MSDNRYSRAAATLREIQPTLFDSSDEWYADDMDDVNALLTLADIAAQLPADVDPVAALRMLVEFERAKRRGAQGQ